MNINASMVKRCLMIGGGAAIAVGVLAACGTQQPEQPTSRLDAMRRAIDDCTKYSEANEFRAARSALAHGVDAVTACNLLRTIDETTSLSNVSELDLFDAALEEQYPIT